MSIRNDTRRQVEKLVYEAMPSIDTEDTERFYRRVNWLVDRLMSLAPLRLAEEAEKNKDWKLVVVDNRHWIGFQEEADYAQVVAE